MSIKKQPKKRRRNFSRYCNFLSTPYLLFQYKIFHQFFRELQEKLGLSYLFISHDLDVVRWFCDEIAVMEEGKFVETGRTEDVIGHPKMEFTKKLVENFILE